MNLKQFAVALSACAAFVSTQAPAASVAGDFSIGSNPGGAWSYGYTPTLGGAFTLDTFQWVFGNSSNFAFGWAGGNPSVTNPNPSVLYLLGTSGTFNFSTISAPSNSVNLHPGALGQLAVARWTVPTTGSYLLSGFFRGNDTTGTTTDVHILKNGGSFYNSAINGFGAVASFAQTIALTAGDRLDFAVGRGSNNTYVNDSTGLSAMITAVPEPSTYALMLAGLGVVAFIARRRAKADA